MAAAALLFSVVAAHAQQQPQAPEPRIVVTGEGSVSVAPNYAHIKSGVTTRAKTVKEAVDANSKTMAAIIAALKDAGIADKDIQTARFSIQPVYAAPAPNAEPKLSGYSVSNQVNVTVREIGKVGDALDRVVAAGATDAGSVSFLVANPSKALDQAREAAMADARRKAEVYAQAAGVRLGRVEWITEDTGNGPLPPVPLARALAKAAPPPIESGEETLRVRITVGFDIAR
ncbi:MAG TPA: SIMPL domain-containing protein [Xanthobacteraceae bacterium]